MAALGLISALSAHAAEVPISSLPFNITAPGIYIVITGNLSYTAQRNPAITIPSSLSGPVVVDLGGFTLTGGGGTSVGVAIGPVFTNGPYVSNAYPITVRNGTLQNFAF